MAIFDGDLYIAEARAGDHAAFDTIVLRYQGRIARYILRLVNDPDLALDLTQDTFVEAFRAIHALRSDLALGAWLYRIATNLAIRADKRRRRIFWQRLGAAEEIPALIVESPDSTVLDRQLVRATLSQLPRDRAACLLLHVNEGFSYDEIAAIMGTTPEAVRKRIARAKERFRALYDAASEEVVLHAVR